MARLDDVAASVRARVPYLTCRSGVPPEVGWISCADLVADAGLLRACIDASAPSFGTDRPQVAASLFVQGYAFRVPGIAVAAAALGLPVPPTAPRTLLVRLGEFGVAEVAIRDAECHDADIATVATELLDGHLAPLVETVRASTRVGQRMLWGNVAASLAAIFRALDAGPRGDPSIRGRAVEFERAAAPWLDGLGHYSTIETPAAVGWYWTRTSCCLWYRTASGSYCDDCSLRDPAEVTSKRLAELTDMGGSLRAEDG